MPGETLPGKIAASGGHVHLDAVPVGRRVSRPSLTDRTENVAGEDRPWPLPSLSKTLYGNVRGEDTQSSIAHLRGVRVGLNTAIWVSFFPKTFTTLARMFLAGLRPERKEFPHRGTKALRKARGQQPGQPSAASAISARDMLLGCGRRPHLFWPLEQIHRVHIDRGSDGRA